MRWSLSHRFDPRALPLADVHYSRQKPGTPQFVRPARNVVLLTPEASALWVSVWHYPEWCKHAWPDAWECALFRNEGAGLSSELIREAVAATRYVWGDAPVGMLTAVDPSKVRRKRDPGRCFLRAGFVRCGSFGDGKPAFMLWPDAMPEPAAPLDATLSLFGAA